MISDKVKSAITITGNKAATAAAALQISPQALQNKYQRQSFNTSDLIFIAEALGLQLAFVDQDGRAVVRFDPGDAIRKKASQTTTE